MLEHECNLQKGWLNVCSEMDIGYSKMDIIYALTLIWVTEDGYNVCSLPDYDYPFGIFKLFLCFNVYEIYSRMDIIYSLRLM